MGIESTRAVASAVDELARNRHVAGATHRVESAARVAGGFPTQGGGGLAGPVHRMAPGCLAAPAAVTGSAA